MRRRHRITGALSPTIVITVLLALCCGIGKLAYGTHFRFGHIFWAPVGGNTINFTIQNAWRRTAYSTANGRCVDANVVGLPSVPCSGADGFADVGDVIVEFQGFTQFFPGDSSIIGSPMGPLLYLVTSSDPANNWVFGVALDPNSLPGVDTTITHTYPNPGDFTATVDSCCRISSLVAPNAHINNPDGGYRIETLVNVDTGNSSPLSALPPIVLCPIDALCFFLVPGADPDGDTLNFRLSASAEASGFSGFTQPGPPHAPNAASIEANSGLYSWDTTLATLGPAGINTLYSTQVTIEELDTVGNVKGKSAVDFLIQLVEEDPNPPVIEPPAGSPPICETTQVATVGATKTFDVIGSDPDAGDAVTLNVVGLPTGATMTPSLPVAGNPVSSMFSWTPDASQVGVHVINFSASSTGGGFALCPVTLDVIETIPVAVDVKPQSCLNPLNVGNRGVIPAGILGTADFDVTDVDPASIRLLDIAPLRSALEDVATPFEPFIGKESAFDCTDEGPDGFLDLTLKFDAQEVVQAIEAALGRDLEDGEVLVVTLEGELFDGIPIVGEDVVVIRKKGKQ